MHTTNLKGVNFIFSASNCATLGALRKMRELSIQEDSLLGTELYVSVVVWCECVSVCSRVSVSFCCCCCFVLLFVYLYVCLFVCFFCFCFFGGG